MLSLLPLLVEAASATIAAQTTQLAPITALLADAPNVGNFLAFGPIDDAVDKAVTQLKTLGRPIAILGVVLLSLSWIASGWLPEWAQQNKGVLVKMFMGGVLLGIAPDVVSVFLPK